VLKDSGFQIQLSAMVIDETLQAYGTYSAISGEYGDPSDVRFGLNWYPWHNYVVRMNVEYMFSSYIPVGGLSLPYPVGGNGSLVHTNFMVNF
jgi:hypothetical protein